MKPIYIDAITLPDAWFQCLYNILDRGRVFVIDEGSYAGQKRLEFDYITIRIKEPQAYPLLPTMPPSSGIPDPVDEAYLAQYADYIMSAYKAPSEDYTYGERLCAVHSFEPYDGLKNNYYKKNHGNQIDTIMSRYRTSGHRNNQLVLQIAQPSDLWLGDPPCLRHIDTRIQDGKLHFFIYFRSWDLWGGFPANLAGISLLQEYMAGEIGVKCGEFICSSKGLHLYDYAVDLAKIRCMKDGAC